MNSNDNSDHHHDVEEEETQELLRKRHKFIQRRTFKFAAFALLVIIAAIGSIAGTKKSFYKNEPGPEPTPPPSPIPDDGENDPSSELDDVVESELILQCSDASNWGTTISSSTSSSKTATSSNSMVLSSSVLEQCPFSDSYNGGTTTGSTSSSGLLGMTSPGKWYKMLPSADSVKGDDDEATTTSCITLSTCHEGTDFDTRLRVFTLTRSSDDKQGGQITCVAANDDNNKKCSIGGASVIESLPINISAWYYILVDGYQPWDEGNFTLSVHCHDCTVPPPPTAINDNSIVSPGDEIRTYPPTLPPTTLPPTDVSTPPPTPFFSDEPYNESCFNETMKLYDDIYVETWVSFLNSTIEQCNYDDVKNETRTTNYPNGPTFVKPDDPNKSHICVMNVVPSDAAAEVEPSSQTPTAFLTALYDLRSLRNSDVYNDLVIACLEEEDPGADDTASRSSDTYFIPVEVDTDLVNATDKVRLYMIGGLYCLPRHCFDSVEHLTEAFLVHATVKELMKDEHDILFHPLIEPAAAANTSTTTSCTPAEAALTVMSARLQNARKAYYERVAKDCIGERLEDNASYCHTFYLSGDGVDVTVVNFHNAFQDSTEYEALKNDCISSNGELCTVDIIITQLQNITTAGNSVILPFQDPVMENIEHFFEVNYIFKGFPLCFYHDSICTYENMLELAENFSRELLFSLNADDQDDNGRHRRIITTQPRRRLLRASTTRTKTMIRFEDDTTNNNRLTWRKAKMEGNGGDNEDSRDDDNEASSLTGKGEGIPDYDNVEQMMLSHLAHYGTSALEGKSPINITSFNLPQHDELNMIEHFPSSFHNMNTKFFNNLVPLIGTAPQQHVVRIFNNFTGSDICGEGYAACYSRLGNLCLRPT